jgi:glycosyltransferase involved in cell wall biosynthesis
MRTCIVIPYHNHPGAIGAVVAALKPLGLPCRIVDDGSGQSSHEAVARIAGREGWVTLQRLEVNQGKGGAVMAGCDAALAQGFTHVLQIDADGQHDAAEVPRLLALSRGNPAAVITGQAVYDESVPRARLYGRYLTHFWVWINTLSFGIRDSMCGLRVYPLAPTCAIWRRARVGRRMDFDVEILVRLSWRGVQIVNVPTRVTYPADGVSHFKVFRDNALISAMHTRMFFGMLWRSPMLLARKFTRRPSKVPA